MLSYALHDMLNDWTGTERGGNPVKFAGHWHTLVAMRPQSASGGFILLIRNKAQSVERIRRKAAEVYTPAQAMDWYQSLCRGYDSTAPDINERKELIRLLAKAINALPYASFA